MTTRYEQYDKQSTFDDDTAVSHDREISLGTTTVLGIFVALTLVCALFFGFGYSMGRRSTPPILSNVNPHVSAPAPSARLDPDAATADTNDLAARRPSPEHSDAPEAVVSSVVPHASTAKPPASVASPAVPKRVATPPAIAAASDTGNSVAPARSTTAPDKTAAPVPQAIVKPVTTASAPQSYVQVAAISHKEDADLLLASLRRRGYAAVIRQQPQDNLLHIQIGPFATKKEADTMRQKLLTDGYNALVK